MYHVKNIGKKIYDTGAYVTNSAYNMTPNIKALPDDRHIANAANMASQTPLIKDVYLKRFNPLERTYLQTNFIGDERKINSTTNTIDKMALKGIKGLGQINSDYDKIKSTPGVKEQYELYKSNSGGKKRRKTKRKNMKKKKRGIKSRRHTRK
jgi:hypothetical protein